MSVPSQPVVVFIGPSLRPDRVPPLGNDWILRGPAAQGDVIKTVLEQGPCTIALVDGFFQKQPAVRHKELLWALSKGARLFGASSMGALRAAELADQGMVGCGLIYRWYRRYLLTPDDAVAVVHGPEELAFAPLSDALIDLRMTFKAARRAGFLTRSQEKRLTEIAAGLSFSERTLSKIVVKAIEYGFELQKDDLQPYKVSQKERDALTLLRHVSNLEKTGALARPLPAHAFIATDAFLADAEAAGIPLDLLETSC